MASVLPPVADYQPRLPKALVSSGALSDAQLEAVVYAGQAHSQMLPAAEGESRSVLTQERTDHEVRPLLTFLFSTP